MVIYAGITGSRYGHPDVERWMLGWIARRGETTFVVGDNHDSDESVDWQALQVCIRYGIPVMRVRRDPSRPWKERNRERNQMMADIVRVWPDRAFLGFPCQKSRGTWHCLRRAEAGGIETFVNRRLLSPHVAG